MKMKDVFEGKVILDSTSGKVGGGCLEIGDNLGWIAHFGVHNERDINESNEAAIHAIHAINNHDKLVNNLYQQKLDIEKVISNLASTGNDDTWSVVKLNNMIVDIDALLAELEDEEVLNTISWVFAAAVTVCASVVVVMLFAVELGRVL